MRFLSTRGAADLSAGLGRIHVTHTKPKEHYHDLVDSLDTLDNGLTDLTVTRTFVSHSQRRCARWYAEWYADSIDSAGAIPARYLPCSSSDEPCLLYTSDAADEEDSVDLGGRRIIKKKTNL